MTRTVLLLWMACCMGHLLPAQEKKSGPVIPGYGAVWEITNAGFATDTTKEFKVMFDIKNSPEAPEVRNAWIETAARFLNMHAQAGVPRENLHVALIVHNKASKDLLNDADYEKRYGVPNPNSEMLQELMAAGAQVIFCGQSSLSRNVPIESTVEGVQLSLSAMTAILQLTDKNYTLIKF